MQAHEVKFVNYLKSRNLKLTRSRRIILEAVFNTHEHFNVDLLYDQIRKRYDDVSRATLYRTMPLLVDCGLIKQSLRCQSKDHYEHTFGHKRHCHLICLKCGRIIEVGSARIEKQLQKLAADKKFEIREFNVGARGICSSCREE